MQSKYRLLSSIARGIWAVEPSLVEGYVAFIDDLFAHKSTATSELDERKRVKQAANDKVSFAKLEAVTQLEAENYWRDKEQQFYAVHPETGSRTLFFDDAKAGSVAVIPVEDIIMRYDFCGAMGLETIEQVHVMAMAHKNITGVVYKFHTPGGSVDYLKEASNTIANSPKPVIGFITSMCTSAGMYLASQCDYVIAENDLALVGSIGVMMTLRDTRKRDEKEGVRTIVIYGPESTHKNKVYQDAIDGKTDAIISEQLAPLNEDIISAVKSGRGEKLDTTHPTLLKGATFMSKDILEAGIIDEINSFSYAINMAAGKVSMHTIALKAPSAEAKPNHQNSNSNMFNKFPKLTAIAGKQSSEITAEEIEAVNAELKEKGVNATLLTEAALQEQITAETTLLKNQLKTATDSTAKANDTVLAAVKVFDPSATAETAATFDLAAKITALKNADGAEEAKLKAEKETATGDAVKAVEEMSLNEFES